MTVTAAPPPSPRKTLAVCGGAHALHDGFTDLLNVLYRLLQAQFSLSYAAIGTLKAIYSSAMASGQIPSGWLAKRLGGVTVLTAGTLLIAVGYGLAGFSGSLYGVCLGLLLVGLHRIALAHRAGHLQFHRRRRQGGAARPVFADRRRTRLARGHDGGSRP